ncbi:Uncharacterised protein [uncultured archaeon]|nr:Uncharacterised protein [uncultured archaeon]
MFGSKFLSQIKDPRTPEFLLEQLSAKNKKIVLDEFKRRTEFAEAIVKNKCEHVKVYAKLKRSRNRVDRYNALQELLGFQSPSKGGGMIICATCKFPLVCPHLVQKITDEFKGLSIADVDNNLIPFTENIKVITDTGELYTYFCKICSEILMEDRSYEEHDDMIGMNEEIQSVIWHEVSNLANYVVFKHLTNLKMTTENITKVVYSMIPDAILNVDINEVNTIEAILACNAYFLTLITDKTITIPTIQSSKIDDYASHLIKRVLSSEDELIRLTGITEKKMKTIMKVYYGKFKEDRSEKVVERVNMLQLLQGVIENDPVFQSAQLIAHLCGDLPDELTVKNTDKYFTLLIGDTVPDILEKIVKLAKVRRVEKPERLYSKVYTTKKKGLLFDVYRSLINYVNGIDDPAQLQKMRSEVGMIETQMKYDRLKPISLSNVKQNNKFQRVDVPINVMYDLDGNKHDWSIAVYEDGVEVDNKNKADLAKIKVPNIVDWRCKVCKILKSKVSKLDVNQVDKMLKIKLKLNSLLDFFDERCPKGDLHEISKDVCSKCGFKKNMNRDEKLAYFDKYVKEYESLNKPEVVEPSTFEPEPIDEKLKLDVLNFKLDLTNVLKISELADVKPIMLEFLPEYEGKIYDNIVSGSYISEPIKDKSDFRILRMKTIVRMMISDYNVVKFYSNNSEPSKQLQDFIENKLGIKDTSSLSQLPDIYDTFDKKSNYFVNYNVIEHNNFCLQFMCDKLLNIKQSSIGELAKLEILKLIASQKLLCKPKAKSQAFESLDAVNFDTPTEIGEDMLDAQEEKDEARGFGATDPFSLADVDMGEGDEEDEPNLEPN